MGSKKFAIAKQLGGRRVITNKGEEIGRLSDILIDEKTGKIESFLLEPNHESKLSKNLTTHDRMVVVPYKSVFAVSDVIVVDESLLV
ncbi:PRC-barrel domain-containing protein [archaeon]|nr:PRC-barrel domain-containing protein [archaeon]